ncbi:hypothetical protein [Leucobacter sp. gxy201]|uniref:hypothetical protein n=1 Tax=Leucobacter sp. gxy201 TaxID=2957200 RepID=UPI003DA04ACC
MNRILKVTRLHLVKASTFMVAPLMILAIVMAISVVIAIAIQRALGDAASTTEYIEGARYNSAIMWALPGFLIYYGVQAIATTYPFALALGTTRRDFILGTVIANAVQSAYIALLLLVLLGLELVTNHWFAGVYVLDTYVVGAGDPVALVVRSFVGVLFCLTAGGMFGAVWVRFGPKGPAVVGLALGLVVALGVLIIAPRIGEIIASVTVAGLGVATVIAVIVCLVATWFAMRRASVR